MYSNATYNRRASTPYKNAASARPEAGAFERAALLALMLWFAAVSVPAWGQDAPTAPDETEITRKDLLNAAYGSLWRLQRSIEKDGFYSARVALNVWRSNAIDAGIFKQAEYDAFKRQIYEKSIQSSLECIEKAVTEEDFNIARACLHTWKMHSQEIGTFDQARFDEMQETIEEKSKAVKTVSE